MYNPYVTRARSKPMSHIQFYITRPRPRWYHPDSCWYSLIPAHRIRWVNTTPDNPTSHSLDVIYGMWIALPEWLMWKVKGIQVPLQGLNWKAGSQIYLQLFTWCSCVMLTQVVCKEILELFYGMFKTFMFLIKKSNPNFFPTGVFNCGDLVFSKESTLGHSSKHYIVGKAWSLRSVD